MTIRSRLLLLLMPAIIIIIALISAALYFNSRYEIMASYTTRLKAATTSCAQFINAEQHNWLVHYSMTKGITTSQYYNQYYNKLRLLKQKLHLTNLYTLIVDPPPKPSYDMTYPKPTQHQIVIISTDPTDQNINKAHNLTKNEINTLYREKKIVITETYTEDNNNRLLLSAYAPVLDNYGHVVAILAADIDISNVHNTFHRSLSSIILSATLIIALAMICIVIVANNISRPIKKLNRRALTIAAGEYGNTINIKGPKEIKELANTLNTMSGCLKENFDHLEQNSIQRERMYGEHECALLLQHYMIEKTIKNYAHPNVEFLAVSAISNNPHGLLATIRTTKSDSIRFTLLESPTKGFANIYKLISSNCPLGQETPTDSASLKMVFAVDKNVIHIVNKGMPLPVIWSQKQQAIVALSKEDSYFPHDKDILFFYNQGLEKLFENNSEELKHWFEKVLEHFADEGLENCMTIFDKELHFLTRKSTHYDDVYIIGMAIHNG